MTNAQHTGGPLVTTKIDCESGWVDILATDGRHDDLPVGSTRHGAAEANARLLVAAFNSYDKHFGPNAIAAAEADLLGEALELLRQHRDYIADTLNGVDLREYGKLVADDLVMVDTLLAKAGRVA
jgi:hypothetical protein